VAGPISRRGNNTDDEDDSGSCPTGQGLAIEPLCSKNERIKADCIKYILLGQLKISREYPVASKM